MSFRPKQSEVEESTTLDKEPTQDKTGNSGRFLDSLRSLGMTYWGTLYLLSFRPKQSGVEESTTLVKEPTQDKTSNSGRFLDSHSLPRNDMSGGSSIQPNRLYSLRPGRQVAAPTVIVQWVPVSLIRLRCLITCTDPAHFSPGPGGNLRSVSGRTGNRHPGTFLFPGRRRAWPPGGR